MTALLTKLQETFKSLGGEVTKAESWGKRRLAYEIRKQREGTYAVIEGKAEPTMMKEYERQLTLNEQVLRHDWEVLSARNVNFLGLSKLVTIRNV